MDLFNNQLGHAAANPDYSRLYQYLRLSRSFRIAQEVLAGKLSKDEVVGQIPDIDQVLKVANDFNKILRSKSFEDWWQTQGLILYGERGPKPIARVIAELPAEYVGASHTLHKAVLALYPNPRMRTEHANFYVEIPKSLTRAELLRFVNSLHDQIQQEKGIIQPLAKYKLTKSKVNDQTLDLGLEFLRLYMNSGLSMWRIASKIGLSKTLSDQVNPDAKRQPHTSAPITRSLDVMANKLKHKAIALAENAARGVFPSTAPLPFSPPDYR